ncbi:MAG: type II toxin-antitoxin system PemK/MazF family toxin [Gracilibacteraceae bacterium]|jgi:mRNA interferase MazF|nr:type II toxin-antitoxin system PemK/MazF family toxin [Gracilibacteraceae bacterium]
MVKQGDIIKLDFSPTIGHEQSSYRPAVVVSNDFAIAKTNVVYIAPITGVARRFPLHVALDDRTKTTGEILCEQVKSVDLNARRFTFTERLPSDILERVLTCIIACFDSSNLGLRHH